jgi:hypothetical protein
MKLNHLIAVLMLSLSSAAYTQTSTVRWQLSDLSGAPIPNVAATSTQTGCDAAARAQNITRNYICLRVISVTSAVPIPTPVPVPSPNPVPAPDTASIPLSWNAPIFASVANSGRLSLPSGSSRSNLSIAEQSGEPSILCQGSCTLDRIRISSREGYRCVEGNQTLTNMWIEAVGTGTDHADGIQCYSPGSTGTVTVKNTTIKVGGEMNAAYFAADNWNGSHVLENVLLWGGNFAFFVPGDGGSSVSLTNVFVLEGSNRYGAIRMDTVNGKRPTILKWDNVRYVSIVNGQLVMGALIPRPY